MSLSFEQIITLLTILGTGIGALLGYVKVIGPEIAKWQARKSDETAKQREHERQMQADRIKAERENEVNRWQQMVELQNSQSQSLATLQEFVLDLATDKLNESDTKILDQLAKNQHELRELRTNISILVNEARRQEDYREQLSQIPLALTKYHEQQAELYQQVIDVIRNGAKRGNDDST